MSKNIIALTIGGKVRTLEFDFGTLDHIEDITGEDPLLFTFDTTNYKSLKKGVAILIDAGMRTAEDTDSFDPAWVKKMTIAQISKVIAAWGHAKSVNASEEVEPDTQP